MIQLTKQQLEAVCGGDLTENEKSVLQKGNLSPEEWKRIFKRRELRLSRTDRNNSSVTVVHTTEEHEPKAYDPKVYDPEAYDPAITLAITGKFAISGSQYFHHRCTQFIERCQSWSATAVPVWSVVHGVCQYCSLESNAEKNLSTLIYLY